jgi:hypothetical protein
MSLQERYDQLIQEEFVGREVESIATFSMCMGRKG